MTIAPTFQTDYSSIEDDSVKRATLLVELSPDELPVQAEPDFLPDAYYQGIYSHFAGLLAAQETRRIEAEARQLAHAHARRRIEAEVRAAHSTPRTTAPARDVPPPPEPPRDLRRAAPQPQRGGGRNSDIIRIMNGISLGGAIMPDPSHMSEIVVEGLPAPNYELVSDNRGLEHAINDLMAEPVLAVDTETTGFDPYNERVLLVQVASPVKCYIIDALRVDITPLKRLLSNERILKLGHNLKFDYKVIKQMAQGPAQSASGVTIENIYDSFLAEKLLTAGLGMEANLKAVVKRYMGGSMNKETRDEFIAIGRRVRAGMPINNDHIKPELLEYACIDALSLFPVYLAQRDCLRKERLEVAANIEFKCAPAVGELELAGCKIDTVKWRSILAEVEKQRDIALDELMLMLPSGGSKQESLFGDPSTYTFNVNSGQQIIAEFKRLGITITDTSEPTLQKVEHPAAKKLLQYRGYEKTLGAFGEGLLAMINKKTGRIHADFMQYGADTGRFSAQNPNVQQIPATSDFRSCFIAAEGYKLVTCDYSQAELRILAELSQDEGFVTAFNTEGVDLHKLTASKMFNVPYEEVSKAQRSASKAINFGLAYGMGAQGLAARIEVPQEDAQKLIDQYFQAYTGVQNWLNKAARDAVRQRYSITPSGRKRYYDVPDRDDPEYRRKMSAVERRGKNSPIQGANSDMTKMALVFLRTALQGYDARIVNTVHDEIVVEVREDQAEIVCEIVEREMRRAGEEIIKTVPIISDAKIGDYWSK